MIMCQISDLLMTSGLSYPKLSQHRNLERLWRAPEESTGGGIGRGHCDEVHPARSRKIATCKHDLVLAGGIELRSGMRHDASRSICNGNIDECRFREGDRDRRRELHRVRYVRAE